MGKLAALLLAAIACTAAAVPTATQLDAFRKELLEVFSVSNRADGTSAGGPPVMRTLVRLGFHDCASPKCDACIDPTSGNNPGLGDMVTALDPVCAKYEAEMSKADCWAAAASIALEEHSKSGADVVKMPLFFGRQDAAICDGFTKDDPEAPFPSGEEGRGPSFQYFEDTFGFTERETVIIMGVHSLGGGAAAGSGFEGRWTQDPNAFDNSFYSGMANPQQGWKQEQVASGLWQWTSQAFSQLMLNSDMMLLKDIFSGSTGGEKGEATCDYNTCPPAPTAPIVDEFSKNNTQFVTEFRPVFVKMLTKGYEICELTVVASSGLGAEVEGMHGVTEYRAQCAAQGFAPPGTILLDGTGAVTPAKAAAPPAATPAATPAAIPAPVLPSTDIAATPADTAAETAGTPTSADAKTTTAAATPESTRSLTPAANAVAANATETESAISGALRSSGWLVGALAGAAACTWLL